MCCQNRWLGSISAPTRLTPPSGVVSSTSRFIVAGLNTRLCGCISMATLTSLSAASSWISFQNGTATSFHW